MKKNKIIILIAGVCLAACAVRNKAEYELPDEMLPHVKIEYKKICDRGQALYNLACARCHNLGTKRHPVIPDFKPEELKGYALRVSNARHEANMPDSLVSEEDLSVIMTFLNYKKKRK